MAKSCCGGSSGTPSPGNNNQRSAKPLKTTPAPAAGRRTSWGGRTTIPRNPCAPAPCPSPLTSDAPDRDPYSPSWIASLTASFTGKVLLVLSGALYYLRSKCTGFLYYDADTEQVSVVNPSFVSNVPQERDYGFLAKVVPMSRNICDDSTSDCAVEAVQELASQEIGEAVCGDLMLVNAPLAGEVSEDEDTDLDKQVNISRASLPDLADVSGACSTGAFILMGYPTTRSDNTTPCTGWAKATTIRMPEPNWNPVEAADVVALSRGLILMPVAGGTGGHQCYELRMFDGQPVNVDTTDRAVANCDMLKYKDGVWKPYKGMVFRPISAPTTIYNLSNAANGAISTATLPEYPTDACGPVWGQFEFSLTLTGAAAAASIIMSNFDTGFMFASTGYFNQNYAAQAMFELTNGATLKVKTARSLNTNSTLFVMRLLGYWL